LSVHLLLGLIMRTLRLLLELGADRALLASGS
jgi:hypothetical protein